MTLLEAAGGLLAIAVLAVVGYFDWRSRQAMPAPEYKHREGDFPTREERQ